MYKPILRNIAVSRACPMFLLPESPLLGAFPCGGCFFSFVAAFAFLPPPPAATPADLSVSRLPRTNLMVYHSTEMQLRAVRTKADWQKRRKEFVQGAEAVLGPLPGNEKG